MICDKLRKLINLGVTTLLFEEMTLHPKLERKKHSPLDIRLTKFC